MPREPYELRPWHEAKDPKKMVRNLDMDEVPEDIIRDLVRAHVVRAECERCGEAHVYSIPLAGQDNRTCLNPNCDEELFLGSI